MTLKCNPTGRLTWADLKDLIDDMDMDQLYTDVTIETADDGECFAAELRICDTAGHAGNGSLDEYHPVLYLDKMIDFQRKLDRGST